MALPKEPRQKMINLMYLVLTALLALNVSAEILNAFRTVDNSLGNANTTIDKKNQQLFSSFDALKNDPKTRERAQLWGERANHAKEYSSTLITYLEGLKLEIKKAAELNPKGEYKEDDLEAATRIMTSPGTKGEELLKKLSDFKANLLAIDDSVNLQFKDQLPIDLKIPVSKNEASNKSWSSAYFNMTPAIAAVTILSKFENDVKNSEAMVVDFCHQQVGAVAFVIDQYQALVGQNSNYLMPGGELLITAGIGAFNSNSKPVVTVDGQSVPLNANGVAEYKSTVGGPNPNVVKKVHIVYVNQATGLQESKDVDVKYAVGSPTGASVSADDVKVLYVDLNNHLSINGGNVGSEKVQASLDNGTLDNLGNGKYVAHPAKPGEANITLDIAGQQPQKFTFKVKSVPDPVGIVGNNKGGRMRVNEFKAQFGVGALLENFVFEGVKFKVVGFTIVCTGNGFPQLKFADVAGDSFDPVRGTIIEQTRPGTTVVIDNIKASGPGGTRTLPPIAFNLF